MTGPGVSLPPKPPEHRPGSFGAGYLQPGETVLLEISSNARLALLGMGVLAGSSVFALAGLVLWGSTVWFSLFVPWLFFSVMGLLATGMMWGMTRGMHYALSERRVMRRDGSSFRALALDEVKLVRSTAHQVTFLPPDSDRPLSWDSVLDGPLLATYAKAVLDAYAPAVATSGSEARDRPRQFVRKEKCTYCGTMVDLSSGPGGPVARCPSCGAAMA